MFVLIISEITLNNVIEWMWVIKSRCYDRLKKKVTKGSDAKKDPPVELTDDFFEIIYRCCRLLRARERARANACARTPTQGPRGARRRRL